MAYFSATGTGGGTIELKTLTNLIPIMTSDTTPSGVASASGTWDGGNSAWRAFADAGNQWTSSPGQKVGAWLQYKFASAQKIQLLFVKNTQYTVAKSFKIQGSNDGSTYVDIATLTVPDVNGLAETLFLLPNNNSYLYYRLYVTEAGPINQLDAVGFKRIKMY